MVGRAGGPNQKRQAERLLPLRCGFQTLMTVMTEQRCCSHTPPSRALGQSGCSVHWSRPFVGRNVSATRTCQQQPHEVSSHLIL